MTDSRLVAPRAVHQFHDSTSVGDAITNSLLYTRDLLRELGLHSEIYAAEVPSLLASEIRSAPTFQDGEDTLLLVHYSWFTKYGAWLQRLRCRKVIVYHNVTPGEFFLPGSDFERLANLSRQQLQALRPIADASVAMSSFSARELLELGYSDPQVLQLLFDPDAWAAQPYDDAYLRVLQTDEAYKLLFVGRVVRNKDQHGLVRALAALKPLMQRPVRLLLAGGLGADASYGDSLRELVFELGLEGSVDLLGKVDDARLRALYAGADAFVCLSDHEGFCVPVIEAMRAQLPVVAYAAAALPETIGTGGLLLSDKRSSSVASAVKVLAEEPALRRRLVEEGRLNLRRFTRSASLRSLALFLRDRIGVSLQVPSSDEPATPARARWRIEGPFDSSYSLAIVNRSLAVALNGEGIDVGLYSTEGPGDFDPDPAFVSQQPDIARLWQRGQTKGPVDVSLRNLYPPRVAGSHAAVQMLGSWGWEESGIPPAWVANFNGSLNLITTVSRFVAKVLVDNGVRVPIVVVGNGCENVATATVENQPKRSSNTFRFLHVSSGLPRKGIDVLLEAWGRAFTVADDVELVIKTMPNPHNDVANQLVAWQLRYPDHAPVDLIDRDLKAEALSELYRSSDAYVAPSRGEGFGLPVAEAMRCGLPVVVTGHGGALDFCDGETAWLVDYRFAPAATHFALFGSAWAEPSVEDLVRTLWDVKEATPGGRCHRTHAAREVVSSLFTWRAVARRTIAAVQGLADRAVLPPLPTVAWITTWNIRCGIASYARELAAAIPPERLRVLASRSETLVGRDEPSVVRCWNQGWDDPLEDLYAAILRSGSSTAVFQFNFGFFQLAAFGRLLDRLHTAGIETVVMMHSTQDVDRPDLQLSLRSIASSLSRAKRLLVHGIADLNTLKAFDLLDNVALFPHGVRVPRAADVADLRRRLNLEGRTILATFGYLLPNKGLPVLLEALHVLRKTHPQIHLLMLNALYPVADSQAEYEHCQAVIGRHGLQDHVTLCTDYLADAAAQELLQVAELIVYPYQRTQESASGAVRFGLASGRPVACTPLPIFDDVDRAVHRLPGVEAADIAVGVDELLRDEERLASVMSEQERFVESCNWTVLSQRLWNILQAPPILDLVAADQQTASPLSVPLRVV